MTANDTCNYGLPDSVLDRIPTRKELLQVTQEIGDNHQLAIMLDLELPKLERIRQDHRDCQSQTLTILTTWKDRDSSPTVRKLCGVLKDLDINLGKITAIFK